MCAKPNEKRLKWVLLEFDSTLVTRMTKCGCMRTSTCRPLEGRHTCWYWRTSKTWERRTTTGKPGAGRHWHRGTCWCLPSDNIDIVSLGDIFHMTSWHLVICSKWHHWHHDTWWYVPSDIIDIVIHGDMFHLITLTLWHLVKCSIWYHWHRVTWGYIPDDIIDIVTVGDMCHMTSWHGWNMFHMAVEDIFHMTSLASWHWVISYFFYDILWFYTFMWNSKFWLTEKHLIKFRLSILSSEPWQHALAHDSTWHWPILLDNG